MKDDTTPPAPDASAASAAVEALCETLRQWEKTNLDIQRFGMAKACADIRAMLRQLAGERDAFRDAMAETEPERVAWKIRALAAEAERDRLKEALAKIRDHAGTHTVNRDGPKNYGYAGIYAWADDALADGRKG